MNNDNRLLMVCLWETNRDLTDHAQAAYSKYCCYGWLQIAGAYLVHSD